MAELVEAPDDLYGVDLADFVRERNALAARLKAAGDTEAAAAVRAMRKPPRSVAALNALARSEPAQVDQVLAAARAVADALGAGGDQLRAAQSAYAQAVTVTVDAAADRAGITGEALERVRSTLLASGAEPDSDVATRLRSGTLAEDAAAPGFSFAGVVAGAQRLADVERPTEPTDDDADAAAAAAAEAAAAAAAEAEAAARRLARRRKALEQEIERIAERAARLADAADTAEAAAVDARATADRAQDELRDAQQRLQELEQPDG